MAASKNIERTIIYHTRISKALALQKKIDSHNLPFTLNTSIGCLFACSYCYLQGLPFRRFAVFGKETKVKTWIPAKLDAELNKYRNIPQHLKRVQVNNASEGYLPWVMTKVKRDLNRDIVLEVLQVFKKHWDEGNKWMVHLVTKSHMILEHIDLLKGMSDQVQVELTITTLDEGLRKRLEGYAPTVAKRLEVIKELSDAGIFVRVMCMPCLGTHQVAEGIKQAAFANGAKGFKHKELNYWDPELMLDGKLKKAKGQHNTTFTSLLEKSEEPVLTDGQTSTVTLLMPVKKLSNMQETSMTVVDSGYSGMNRVDWGYLR